MRGTGKARDERLAAAVVALTANGLIAWALMALLTPDADAVAVNDEASLQVVWIEAPAAQQVAVRTPTQGHGGHARRAAHALDPLPRAQPPTPTAAVEAAPEITPSRSMAAVYLQQVRQIVRDQSVSAPPADPFANRRVALRDQAGSRFRLAHSSPAATVAKLGKFFGGAGYTTDDCGAIDERLLGLVVAGDDRAVQQDLDYERRNCRR